MTGDVYKAVALLGLLGSLAARPTHAHTVAVADADAAGAASPVAVDEARAMFDSTSPDPRIRSAAAVVLSRAGTLVATDRLILMIWADVDPGVRLAVVEALGATYNPEIAPLMHQVAGRDADASVRAAAARHAELLTALGKSPSRAAGMGILCPGCGYFYLGRPGRALAYLAPGAALLGAAIYLAEQGEEPLPFGEGPRRDPSLTPLAFPAAVAALNLWSYGIYASYRDARLARKDLGYRYPVSPEGLPELLSAPFRPRVLARPWFWAGLPLMLGGALALSALVDDDFRDSTRSLTDGGGVWFLGRRYGTGTGLLLGGGYFASAFLPVGVGEEALFRGVIQPAFTEWLGLWPGWAVTSLLFGAAHIQNFADRSQGFDVAVAAVPYITAVGSYMGAVAIQTGFRLETSVALHFWYDFLLSTAGFIVDPDNQPFALRFGMPF